MKNLLYLLFAATLLAACEKDDGPAKEIEVDGAIYRYLRTERMTVASDTPMELSLEIMQHYPEFPHPLEMVYPKFSILMGSKPNSRQSVSMGAINGFDYEYGFEWVLDVHIYRNPTPLMDSSDQYWRLDKVISKKEMQYSGLPDELFVVYALDTLLIASTRPGAGSYRVKINGGTQWETLETSIARFDHQPGYEYLIHAARWDNPAFPKGYALKRVVSKTRKNSDVPQ